MRNVFLIFIFAGLNFISGFFLADPAPYSLFGFFQFSVIFSAMLLNAVIFIGMIVTYKSDRRLRKVKAQYDELEKAARYPGEEGSRTIMKAHDKLINDHR